MFGQRRRIRDPRLAGNELARRGAATLDYVLTMAVIFPLAVFLFWAAPKIMNLVYEMTCVLISWPFL